VALSRRTLAGSNLGMENAFEHARRCVLTQRSRDVAPGQLTLDYFVRKAAEGWTLAAVEWVREVEAEDEAHVEPVEVSPRGEDVPYGLRMSEEGLHLEAHPVERTVLLLILEKIVREKAITQIANELNSEGFRTRRHGPWTPSAVFDLLPRLIEVSPALLKSRDWQELRARRPIPN
jgi:recombinase